MALIRSHHDILQYLLDCYSKYWPKNIFDDWFKDKLIHHKFFSQDHILKVIRIYFSSKTCKSVFSAMTSKKQKEWICEFVNQIETSLSLQNEKEKSIRAVALSELTNAPYAG